MGQQFAGILVAGPGRRRDPADQHVQIPWRAKCQGHCLEFCTQHRRFFIVRHIFEQATGSAQPANGNAALVHGLCIARGDHQRIIGEQLSEAVPSDGLESTRSIHSSRELHRPSADRRGLQIIIGQQITPFRLAAYRPTQIRPKGQMQRQRNDIGEMAFDQFDLELTNSFLATSGLNRPEIEGNALYLKLGETVSVARRRRRKREKAPTLG